MFREAILALGSSPAASIAVKATVVLATALAVTLLARRSRAAIRHALLAGAFGVLLLLPIASISVRPVAIPVPVAGPAELIQPALLHYGETDLPLVRADRILPTAPEASRSTELSWSDSLKFVWAVGTMLFLLPVLVGIWQISRLRRTALPWRHGQSIGRHLAIEAGIRRRVDILLHEELPGPMTCGLLRPAIVLPIDAQGWDAKELDCAIVHELEHIRRGDWLVHSFARLVCAVYWFHPLVWIAWRQLALEAERSCDDAVVGRSDATAYADQLVGLARRLSNARRTPALAMANRSDLPARVRAVLSTSQRRGRLGALAVVLVCLVACAITLTISPLKVVAAPQDNSTVGQPAFEVASVKPSGPPGKYGVGWFGTYPGGGVLAANCTLAYLISISFNEQWLQFPGEPNWVTSMSDAFDIEAKPPASSISSKADPPYPKAPPNDEQRLMLRTLLMERFGLKFHRETKEAPVYLLVKNGKELKLREPKDPNTYPWAGGANGGSPFGDGIRGENITMAQLAKRLTPYMHRPVLDQTGVAGSFDFKYEYAVGDAPRADQMTTILASVQGLGLKLESSKAQVETIVIDHVEKPSAN